MWTSGEGLATSCGAKAHQRGARWRAGMRLDSYCMVFNFFFFLNISRWVRRGGAAKFGGLSRTRYETRRSLKPLNMKQSRKHCGSFKNVRLSLVHPLDLAPQPFPNQLTSARRVGRSGAPESDLTVSKVYALSISHDPPSNQTFPNSCTRTLTIAQWACLQSHQLQNKHFGSETIINIHSNTHSPSKPTLSF